MNKYLKTSKNSVEVRIRAFRPAVLGRAHSRIYVTQQDLQAARTRTPLARVLGLGRQESLTPDKRDVCLVGRNEATFGKAIAHQAAAFERSLHLLCDALWPSGKFHVVRHGQKAGFADIFAE